MKGIILMLLMGMFLAGCNPKVTNSSGIVIEDTTVAAGYANNSSAPDLKDVRGIKQSRIVGSPAQYIPNATIFRMNGDFENNVGVTLSPEGVLTYFPSPSDITADSAPIKLEDGWWLNCQGLSPNSVFTKYTFAEYSSLPETPSPDQIKLEIIPGSHVVDFKELPLKLNDAVKNIDAVNDYIKSL